MHLTHHTRNKSPNVRIQHFPGDSHLPPWSAIHIEGADGTLSLIIHCTPAGYGFVKALSETLGEFQNRFQTEKAA